MTQKSFKITAAVAVIAFVVLNLFCELLDAISYAISLSAFFSLAYDRWLWKFNPFEKTPKIGGIYQANCRSSYNNGYAYTSKITIHQTLSTITVCEQLERGGYCESVTASLVEPRGDGKWKLYYTYITSHQATGKDSMHEGTAILYVMDANTLYGSYFTNRIKQTAGEMTLTRLRE